LPAKQDDLSLMHLDWLVKSRAANQRSALKLFQLFEEHSTTMGAKKRSWIAQRLVAVCFSLWRAAFLADKTGDREAVFVDARHFLGKMLTDNAINYSQDRSAREWTFNYYVNNAKENLLVLSKRWPSIESVRSDTKKHKGLTYAKRRWDRHQAAFETAVECLADELEQSH
jgi:hypothetical protein